MTATHALRRRASGLALALLFTLAGLAPALADRTWDNRDIRGEYAYSLIEAEWITTGDPPVQKILYCTSIGTAIADGAGNLETTGTLRCNLDGTVFFEEDTETMTYEVQPNGEVLFWNPDSADPTHGVIVDHGRTILIDGTTRFDNWIYQHGHAVKR